jgi:hypothetical protein
MIFLGQLSAPLIESGAQICTWDVWISLISRRKVEIRKREKSTYGAKHFVPSLSTWSLVFSRSADFGLEQRKREVRALYLLVARVTAERKRTERGWLLLGTTNAPGQKRRVKYRLKNNANQTGNVNTHTTLARRWVRERENEHIGEAYSNFGTKTIQRLGQR